ncbi:unnamed protein product, partial [Prorocentrum cordatum]
ETRQVKAFTSKELRPRQKTVEESIRHEGDRRVILIHDAVGNIGKSIFSEYLESCVLASKNKRAFLVDLPRATPRTHAGEFPSGLGGVANGLAHDKRYPFKMVRFDKLQT